MFLAAKAASAAIVFLLLGTGISGPRPSPLVSGRNLSQEVRAVCVWKRRKEDAANSAGQRTIPRGG